MLNTCWRSRRTPGRGGARRAGAPPRDGFCIAISCIIIIIIIIIISCIITVIIIVSIISSSIIGSSSSSSSIIISLFIIIIIIISSSSSNSSVVGVFMFTGWFVCVCSCLSLLFDSPREGFIILPYIV